MTENPDSIHTPLGRWAEAHGFAPTGEDIAGETPFLRLGMLGTTADRWHGELDGRDAYLSDFFIDSSGPLSAFGDTNVQGSAFTVLLVAVDAPAWRRVTVHPDFISEHDLLARLFGSERAPRGVAPELEERFHVRLDDSIDDDAAQRFFTPELVRWCLDQPELIFDVEAHENGAQWLAVATRGLDADGEGMEALAAQARYLVEHVERTGALAG